MTDFQTRNVRDLVHMTLAALGICGHAAEVVSSGVRVTTATWRTTYSFASLHGVRGSVSAHLLLLSGRIPRQYRPLPYHRQLTGGH